MSAARLGEPVCIVNAAGDVDVFEGLMVRRVGRSRPLLVFRLAGRDVVRASDAPYLVLAGRRGEGGVSVSKVSWHRGRHAAETRMVAEWQGTARRTRGREVSTDRAYVVVRIQGVGG